MNANPILLQKKYARIVTLFAKSKELPYDTALEFFYLSKLYELLREGIADLHCRSDLYLADELILEYEE